MAESDYDGADSFDTPKVAENGDGTGTFWENSFKKVVNRTKFLRNRAVPAGTLNRVLTGLPINGSTGAVLAPIGGSNLAASVVGEWWFDDIIPHGALVSSVAVWIDPPNDGVLPGTRPQLEFWKYDITTDTATQIGSTTTDPNATVGAYEAVHSFGISGLAETIDRTSKLYVARLTGESGANSTTISWQGVVVTFTLP